ncbi:MAG TPA: hypothetical protein VF817_04945 [Patescibacteria group bacterium]
MTTQSATSNTPFVSSAQSEQGGFSIHTMQDDLVLLKQGGLKPSSPIQNIPKQVASIPASPETPIQQPQPKPKAPIQQKPQQTQPNIPIKRNNPFLGSDNFSATTKTATENHPTSSSFPAPINAPQQHDAPSQSQPKIPVQLVEASIEKKEDAFSKNNSGLGSKILISAISLFVLVILGLGAYYFIASNKSKQQQLVSVPEETTIEQPSQPATEEQPQQIDVPTMPQEKYSQTKQNYLTIDPSKTSLADIKKTLTDLASDTDNLKPSSVYEFSVVDANNAPVAFPIFATAAKINLSQNLLSSLGENFSVYFYNDNGNVRTGLTIDFKDKNATTSELSKQEKGFPAALSNLMLTAAPENLTGLFNSSSYKGYSIRYLNLNSAKSLSVDYALTDKQLIIGTSKDTLRAILDKLATQISTDSNISASSNTAISAQDNSDSTQTSENSASTQQN